MKYVTWGGVPLNGTTSTSQTSQLVKLNLVSEEMGFKGRTSSKSRVTNNNLRTQEGGGIQTSRPGPSSIAFFLPLPFGT